ncbi:arginine--tRNA ligase [Oceanibacterium hippocampi]|uniref:Arginine--tRNA ligase n=1 Tax=Oceanibacterium hippocampi TaxID=745714 RepID=A0A1Y5RY85_9PROT|nr:arginine--tRNA ligase [Oceanibacterium hippocampi]SLN28401.1 Arginine--tRNA ligase [Oceanibacterium hippocampi]
MSLDQSLRDELSALVGAHFGALDLDPAFGQVAPSQRPELGQFQCNGALAAAKSAKRPPRQIADAVVERLARDGRFRDLSIAGPGFVNFSLADDFLVDRVTALFDDPATGCRIGHAPRTVVLDFGGPNVAKAMHVGHLRASIIGDCLQRLCRQVGDRVTSDVHLGDWGLPMGMLIAEIARDAPELPYFDAAYDGPYPDASPVSIDDLQELYPRASARTKEDDEALAAARQATFELQRGRPGYRALWERMVAVSVEAMRADFEALGVRFDLWDGEACVHDLIDPMIQRMTDAGIAEPSEGALIVRVARPDDKAEMPPLVLLKSDGGVMYSTTDLATIVNRVERQDPDAIVYVVDGRQSLHFEQVFRTARLAGLVRDDVALEHVGFGTVNGTDGKPFRTRAGGVVRLSELIAMATEEAGKRLSEAGLAQELSEAERAAIARNVGIAAIKFADLQNQRHSNYVFDLERFTRFEGRTGPYLLYAAVRLRSLLRKAADQGFAAGGLAPETDAERDLMLTLAALPEAVRGAYERYQPHILCEHVYNVAQAFNRFYHDCHILSEQDLVRRGARLRLAEVTLAQIALALTILGLEIPDRM